MKTCKECEYWYKMYPDVSDSLEGQCCIYPVVVYSRNSDMPICERMGKMEKEKDDQHFDK